MSSAAPAVKAALVTQLTTALGSSVLVCYGPPGTNQPDDIVAVLDMRADLAFLAMGGQREEDLSIDFKASVYRGGGAEVQQTVTERAYALMAAVETYLKTTDPTIGGTVLTNSLVARYELTETASTEGRLADLDFTVTATAVI